MADEEKQMPRTGSAEQIQVSNPLTDDNSPATFASSTFKWISICIGIYLTAILYGLDTTIAADVQAPILASLGSIELLPWVGIGFPLGSVATILPVGIMYGLFEVKWLYLTSIVLFEIGSAICGAAPNMHAMIVGRVIAGIGGSGMYLGCLNYVAVFTPLSKRAVYTGLIGVFWGLGAILGPLIGGAFASSSATWRWSFYINLVLAAVTAPVYIFWFPRYDKHAGTPAFTRLVNLDWTGIVLNATMYVTFLIACTFSGASWAWDSGSSIALWVVSGFVTIAFVVQQRLSLWTTPENRIFPVHFLRSRTLVLLFVATAAVSSSVFYPVYYVPLFFQFTRSDTAILAAVRLLPYICVFVACILLSGVLLPKAGWYSGWFLLSGILCLVGSTLLYLCTVTTTTRAIYGFEVLVAAGSGFTMQMGYAIAASKVAPKDTAAAIGFINVAQLGSSALTLAISGAIFQNVGLLNLKAALHGVGFTEVELRTALSGGQSTLLSQNSSQIQRRAIEAIARTISSGYGLVIGASGLLIIAALLMRRERAILT